MMSQCIGESGALKHREIFVHNIYISPDVCRLKDCSPGFSYHGGVSLIQATCCWPLQPQLSLSAAGLSGNQLFPQVVHCQARELALQKELYEAEPISSKAPWKHVCTGSLSHVWPQETPLKVKRVSCECAICVFVCVCVFCVWHLPFFFFFFFLNSSSLSCGALVCCTALKRGVIYRREWCWRWR